MTESRKALEAKSAELRKQMVEAGITIPPDVYFNEQDRLLVYASLVFHARGELKQIADMKSGTASAIAQEALDHIAENLPK